MASEGNSFPFWKVWGAVRSQHSGTGKNIGAAETGFLKEIAKGQGCRISCQPCLSLFLSSETSSSSRAPTMCQSPAPFLHLFLALSFLKFSLKPVSGKQASTWLAYFLGCSSGVAFPPFPSVHQFLARILFHNTGFSG